jgi:hypothetical protein
MAALAWWALGNTLAASFDAAQGSTLARSVSAELLTLARLAALVLVAWAALLVGRALAPRERPSLTIPLAAALALGAAGIALLELPLEIWVVNRFAGVSVAQGSLLAAQDGSVQMVMHLLTFLVACGALLAVARLVRPEWFLRGGRARAAPAAGPTPS